MAGPVMLIIRDGWGINRGGRKECEQNGDATLLARTPFHDRLYQEYPGAKLIALTNAAREAGVTEIFVHAFTDGRDASPTGAAAYLKTCTKELQQNGAQIVTVVGRYFAMDRDCRWDRTKKAWDAIVLGRVEICNSSPDAAVDRQYSLGKTDEFMPA